MNEQEQYDNLITGQATNDFFEYIVRNLNKVVKAKQIFKINIAQEEEFIFGIAYYRSKQMTNFKTKLFKYNTLDKTLSFQTNNNNLSIENLECNKKVSEKFKGEVFTLH